MTRIEFSRLTPAAQRALFEEAASSWCKIFGVPPSDLESYWFEKKSRETIIYVLRDDAGAICGTVTFKYHEIFYENRRLVIVKTGVAALPEARGNLFVARCIVSQAVHHVLRHPFDETYVFSALIHPVSYRICTSFLDTFYPYYDRPQDPELARLAAFLAEHFRFEKPENSPPFVFREARATLETDEERASWQQKSAPAVRFFIQSCPRYASGECFIILAPVSRWFVLRAWIKFGRQWIERRLRRGKRARPPRNG